MTLEFVASIFVIEKFFLLNFVNSLSECWPPILNPIIGILTNKPYRDIIFCCFWKKNTINNIITSKTIQVSPVAELPRL